MLDNDDPDAPNGGGAFSLRLSKNDREKLDQICGRTGLNTTDGVRAAIGIAHRVVSGAISFEQIQGFIQETYDDDS
jgi:hypothetical protein